ncbi:hypothetical protein PSM7751_00846 [Pseudooceanicola marinus]|uniref:Uncharacterized protein n=1 Tax=Pseudooceanicola marinus TaxID=396013 RepID=A0A1X6YLZ2_9RHOB|nr:hypothetical protein [Pseudooceanicola marinus]SLN24706.1 hypothetical protein PSM7751_00846 [Pseudooceanicola marinus]
MDPATTASLIKVGGSLLGGLFGRKKSKPKYVVPPYDKIRAALENAGYNPAAGANAQGAVVSGSQNFMGSAIADAALHLADGMQDKAAQEGEAQKLREENAQLAKKVQDLTIRPRVGGIYSGNVSTPSIRSAMGVSDGRSGRTAQGANSNSANVDSGVSGASDASGGVPLRELSETLPVDPRREVDNNPVSTGPGFMVIDNPVFDFPIYVPTLDGDEPLGFTDLPALGASYLGSRIYANRATLGPKRSTNDLTFGDQGYPRDYARPPGTAKKSRRWDPPYIDYPMYRPTPFAGPR